jgi:DNA-binding transcriptional LysR family regulator
VRETTAKSLVSRSVFATKFETLQLLSLSRIGSMRAVAETHHLTTSPVSQQIAALAKETGAQLIEPEGRRVRLTPAGQRLADHAVTILAAVDAARLDLDPDAEPAGTVRVGGFATGLRVSLFPIVEDLAALSKGRLRDQ